MTKTPIEKALKLWGIIAWFTFWMLSIGAILACFFIDEINQFTKNYLLPQ